MIGIGITAWKRPELIAQTLDNIRAFTPIDKLVIIEKEGISKAKNACLGALDYCEHIFLLDDDTRPIKIDWHLPYINSGEPHLSFSFGRKELSRKNGLIEYEKPCGCMLYINRKCLDVVGGFDEAYQGYAGEHQDYSQRVFNAGLTSAPFLDVEGSDKLIHSMDQHREVVSSISVSIRQKHIPLNMKRLIEQKDSKEFMPYK